MELLSAGIMGYELLAGSYLLSPASGGSKSGSGSLVEACSLTAPQSSYIPGKREWAKEWRVE